MNKTLIKKKYKEKIDLLDYYNQKYYNENISEISAASGVVLDSSAKKEFNENYIKAKSLLDLYK